MALTAEQRALKKRNWERCSPLARKIAGWLKREGYLKIPRKMCGWGLAQYLTQMAAEEIDKALTNAENSGKTR